MTPSSPLYTISSKRFYDTCPLKYQFRYVLGLDAAELSPAFAQGIEFHSTAEQVHTGEVEDLSLAGLGYEKWAKDWEEFTTHKVEHPLVVPLIRIQEFAQENAREPLVGSFAGVTDLVGISQRDGGLYLLDHKSVSRFYTYPRLFSSEQIGMYIIAYYLSYGDLPNGGCISRIRLKDDTHPKYYQNYIYKYLKDNSINTNITTIKKWLKTIGKDTIGKGTRRTTVKAKGGGITLALKEPKKKGSFQIKGLTQRDEAGHITLSIQRLRGVMVHIERQFYTFSPEELREIAKDFLAYVREVQGKEDFRRAPGLHCARCPFQQACEASRKMEVDLLDVVGKPSDWGLQVVAPNREVTQALEKEAETT